MLPCPAASRQTQRQLNQPNLILRRFRCKRCYCRVSHCGGSVRGKSGSVLAALCLPPAASTHRSASRVTAWQHKGLPMSRSTYVGWCSLLTAQLSSILHRELLPVSVGPATTTRGPGRLLSFACCRRFCNTWCVLMYCMLGVSLDLYLQPGKHAAKHTDTGSCQSRLPATACLLEAAAAGCCQEACGVLLLAGPGARVQCIQELRVSLT